MGPGPRILGDTPAHRTIFPARVLAGFLYTAFAMSIGPELRDLLRLTLTPGLGPVLIARLLELFGSPDRILGASAQELERARGIGAGKSVAIVRAIKESAALVDPELELARQLGVRIISKAHPDYPPLLLELPDAPPLLYIRGTLSPADLDRYPVAIVGSRRSTAYGIEQAERFAGVLGRSGLTIVSGGARGIDTAAHRGVLRAGGRTMAILGCGLANCYPPENAALFGKITQGSEGAGGAIISELPLRSAPEADNFPARNRLISGMCLGVIVIEAGRKSGSLITARMAAEDHNREVMAVPGRVDSEASRGTHELLKEGAAALVTDPADVIAILEMPARHVHGGTHESRYEVRGGISDNLFDAAAPAPTAPEALPSRSPGLPMSPAQKVIIEALEEPLTIDELLKNTGMSVSALRGEITILEIQRRIVRQGARLARA
jgi:DNA processing protein